MFDPTDLGEIPSRNVEHIYSSRPEKNSFYARIELQHKKYAFIIRETKRTLADKVVADRLKYLFGLTPVHTLTAKIGMRIDDTCDRPKKILSEPRNYLLQAAPMWRNEEGEIAFVKEPTLEEILKDINLLEEQDFKEEVIKIFLFRFLIGASHSNFSSIKIRTIFSYKSGSKEGKYIPVSVNEDKIGRVIIPNMQISKEHWNELFSDKELVDKLRREMVYSFDHDNMRGILLQSRKPEENIKARKPKKAMGIPAYKMATFIETRMEIMDDSTIEDFIEEYMGGKIYGEN